MEGTGRPLNNWGEERDGKFSPVSSVSYKPQREFRQTDNEDVQDDKYVSTWRRAREEGRCHGRYHHEIRTFQHKSLYIHAM